MKDERPLYIVDKKGPRMKKGKFSKSVVTKELHKRFIENYPEYKDMGWAEFYGSWKEIAESIRIEAATNPFGIKLGSYAGELVLEYMPSSMKMIDRGKSQDLGKNVTYVNLITKGKTAKLKWSRKEAVKFNDILGFYSFSETREINQLCKKHIEQNPGSLRISNNRRG